MESPAAKMREAREDGGIAGSIRAVPERIIYFCLSQCVQMLKYTMEVKGRQTLSKLSEVQFTDWVMQPHF